MGAYEAVVSSGGLAQISDDSLRAALATFNSHMREPYAEQFSNSLYFAFIREYAGLMEMPWNDPADVDSASAALRSSSRSDTKLLQDRRFEGQLALRTHAERDVGRRYRDLEVQAEHVLGLLERQLRR